MLYQSMRRLLPTDQLTATKQNAGQATYADADADTEGKSPEHEQELITAHDLRF